MADHREIAFEAAVEHSLTTSRGNRVRGNRVSLNAVIFFFAPIG